MKPIQGCHLIKPDDLHWRPSNLMRIPTRLWRLFYCLLFLLLVRCSCLAATEANL